MHKNILIVIGFFSLCFSNSMVIANRNFRDTTVIPPFATTNYNDSFYTSVLSSAMGIAQPFLLQQGYITMSGVTVSDTSLVYDGVKYPVSQAYNTNRTTGSDGFYISPTQYSYYGISNFKSIWKVESPNIFFDGTNNTFKTRVDCIGYGARVLAAVGGQTSSTNAFLLLANGILNAGISDFAAIGHVPDSYQMATSFATLGTTPISGWEYIAGNVLPADIQTYNLTFNKSLSTYTGVRKGGFSKAKAGDLFCFGDGPKSSASGHTMIMVHYPILLNATNMKSYFPKVTTTSINTLLSKNKVYQVDIFDDCNYRHFNDSRTIDGVGFGSVLVVADTADDAPMGYFFSPSSNLSYTPISTAKTYAICVARYTSPSQLPVILESFTAEGINNSIQIDWQTAQERNISQFILQHSINARVFEDIATMTANSNGANNYQFTDKYPINGVNYYRLQIIDKDGAVSFSKTISFQISINSSLFSIFPNPAKNIVTIRGNHISSVQVVDNLGRLFNSVRLQDATNPAIAVSHLPSGIYHLRIQTIDGKVSEVGFVKE